MMEFDVSVPAEMPDFNEAADWIEEENRLRAEMRRQRVEAERETAMRVEEEMYAPMRDQLGIHMDPPDTAALQAFTDREYERLLTEQNIRIEERGQEPGIELLLPPQTSSCVSRTSQYTGPWISPSSKASTNASTGQMNMVVSANSFGFDTVAAAMGYWFKAGSDLSGYNAHALVDAFGSGALNGWFGTARLDMYLTLRVFNWNSRRTWDHFEHIPGGSVSFGVVVGAGFHGFRQVSTFCDANRGDWLYLELIADVDARVNALGHASVGVTGDLIQLRLCS